MSFSSYKSEEWRRKRSVKMRQLELVSMGVFLKSGCLPFPKASTSLEVKRVVGEWWWGGVGLQVLMAKS